jgi:chitinase domain-containing protein 1
VLALVGEDNADNEVLLKKVMMGIPFYGYRYDTKPTPKSRPNAIVGHELIKLLKADPNAEVKYHEQWSEHSMVVKDENGVEQEVFYPTLHFIQARLDLAHSLGCSVSVWEIGQGLDYFYDLL